MLRGIVNKAMGTATRRRRTMAPRGGTGAAAGPATRGSGGGSANQEIGRGARSLLRGLGRKRRGL